MSHYGNDWRDTEFGAGQERYYGGMAPPPDGPPPPAEVQPTPPGGGGGGGRKGVIIGVAVALVALLGAGGTYLVSTMGDDGAKVADPSSTATQPATTSSPSASTSATPTATPIVDGWRVATHDGDYPVVFDFPTESKTFAGAEGEDLPEWTQSKADETYGYADPVNPIKPLAVTQFSATYRVSHCGTSDDSATAFVGYFGSTSDAPQAANKTFDQFAQAMSLKEDGKSRVDYDPSEAKTVKVNDGKTSAVQIRADIPWSRTDERFCVRTERELVVTSVPTEEGTGTVVAVRLKDGDTAKGHNLDEKVFERIISSIRPAPTS